VTLAGNVNGVLIDLDKKKKNEGEKRKDKERGKGARDTTVEPR
jgi:hypothetical protein